MFPPERIVCLTEETTETLYRLGEDRRIVGISAFTVRPERARREKPVVSQFIRARTDDIVALEPDLVLAYSDLQADIAADLMRRGLDVHCFNHRTVTGILDMIRMLGAMVGALRRADALASDLRDGLEAVRGRAATLPRRPRVFFEEWPDPIITGSRWVSELVEIAGGVDCFEAESHGVLAKERTTRAEAVLARDPELYLASWCGKKFNRREALSRPGFEGRRFCQEDRMVEIDSAIILQPGPAALTDGVAALHRAIARVAGVT